MRADDAPALSHGNKRFWGYDDVLAADDLLQTAMAVLRRAAVAPSANNIFRGPTDRQAHAIALALVLLGKARCELAAMEYDE